MWLSIVKRGYELRRDDIFNQTDGFPVFSLHGKSCSHQCLPLNSGNSNIQRRLVAFFAKEANKWNDSLLRIWMENEAYCVNFAVFLCKLHGSALTANGSFAIVVVVFAMWIVNIVRCGRCNHNDRMKLNKLNGTKELPIYSHWFHRRQNGIRQFAIISLNLNRMCRTQRI